MKDLKHKIVFGLSAVSVFIDHLLRAFWVLLCLMLALIALAFFGLHDVLSATAFQLLTLLAFLAGAWHGIKQLILPVRIEIEKRLYQANQLPVNPYTVLKDHPTNQLTAEQQTLWESGQIYARQLKGKLHPALPAPKLGQKDRYQLRYITFLLFILGWFYQGSDHSTQLARAFIPEPPGFMTARAEINEIWITPPEHTGLAPLYFDQSGNKTVTVPEGSILTARLSRAWFTPMLITTSTKVAFVAGNSSGYTVEYPIAENDQTLKIKSGPRTRLKLSIKVDQDMAPIVSIADGPELTEDNRISVRYAARDDYGLDTVEIQISPDRMIARRLGNPAPWTKTNRLGGNKFIDQTARLDLTDHALAGLPVEVSVVATDSKGQTTKTDPVSFILPSLEFTHPVARKLASLRQELLWSADADSYHLFANMINKILIHPESFKHDTTVFLGLSSAMYRLQYIEHVDGKSVSGLRDLLWQLALRIEGGSTRVAAEDLQNVLNEMAQALENPNLSEGEFSALQKRLEQAMAEYFQSLMSELAAQMQENGSDMSLPEELKDQVENQMDTGNFMEELMDALQNGSRGEVADALREMERMVEQMKNTKIKPMTEEMRKAVEALAKLKDVIRDQEELLDQTRTITPEAPQETLDYGETVPPDNNSIFNGERSYMPPAPSDTNRAEVPPSKTPAEPVETGEFADTQQIIREDLRDIHTKLEDATGKRAAFIDRADQAMKNARDALVNNAPAASIPEQERALRELKSGKEQAMQQMASGISGVISLGLPSMGRRPGGDTDPLGRRPGQGRHTATDDVDIPEEEKRRRIREIRDRILEKSDGFEKDPLSDEYFDNLLERF
jgi:uncharacterized protein (TIGR02302 family)